MSCGNFDADGYDLMDARQGQKTEYLWPSNFVGGLYYAAFKANGPITGLKWTVSHQKMRGESVTFELKKEVPANCTTGWSCEKVWNEKEMVIESFKVSNFFQDGFYYSMFKIHERIGSNLVMSLKFEPNVGFSVCSIHDILFKGLLKKNLKLFVCL